MAKTITILKPFAFCRESTGRGGLPTEQKFIPQRDHRTKEWIPTEVEIPDDMTEHPWITQDFADGAIERPAATAARLNALKQQLEASTAELSAALAEANAKAKAVTTAVDSKPAKN